MVTEALIREITEVFSDVERTADWALVRSTEGHEPALVVKELTGKGPWQTLDGAFLDQLPDGYGSALSFFSDEAFRYFLPGYLIADLRGQLRQADPVFHLTHGLDAATRDQPVNPRRYGPRSWLDAARFRFSVFTAGEAAAIVHYLEHKAHEDDFARDRIEQALDAYWRGRAGKIAG